MENDFDPMWVLEEIKRLLEAHEEAQLRVVWKQICASFAGNPEGMEKHGWYFILANFEPKKVSSIPTKE